MRIRALLLTIVTSFLFPAALCADEGYFCGWYFKLQSERETLALIPSFHKTHDGNFSSLQVITDDKVWNIRLPYEKLTRNDGINPDITLDGCTFSEKGIHLDVHQEGIDLVGDISFGKWLPLRSNIMGPFRLVPFMQCRHGVWSAWPPVDGSISINGREYIFDGGSGYVEGDRGYSFPSTYIWTQCILDSGSVMLSVADIPMGLFHFAGIIGFIIVDGVEYRIATYNGAKVVEIGDNSCTVRQGDMLLTVRLIRKNAYPLYAPVNGAMDRVIRESASCLAGYTFSVAGRTLLDIESNKASFEYEW